MSIEKTATAINEDAEKCKLLNKKELDEVDRNFSLNALRVLESRYLLKDSDGKVIETPKQLFERIATLVGIADVLYDERVFTLDERNKLITQFHTSELKEIAENYMPLSIGKYVLNQYHVEALIRAYQRLRKEQRMTVTFESLLKDMKNGTFDDYANMIESYYNLMVNKIFLPNTPTIMNAGTRLGQLSACFVLDMDDNIESIMETAKDTAFIFKSGGGVGINYSKLRAENAMVSSTSGVASGPVSFMSIIDKVTDVIKQGGKRRGANMGILESSHPDIKKFITAKKQKGILENFNVSVAMWQSPKDEPLLDLIAESAWHSAEPGVIFLDNVNKNNPLRSARGEPLRATNPCGEQSLYPYESCNLGSINLSKFVLEDGTFDYSGYVSTIDLCTQFLDNIVDMNKYPLKKIEDAAMETRRIGLGVMGLAELFVKLGVRYDSEAGYEFMNGLAELLSYHSMSASVRLAQQRGPFGLFEESDYKQGVLPVDKTTPFYESDWPLLEEEIKQFGIRNSYCTTVAPTGSLSMIADTTSGIEPNFALAYEKRVAVGRFFYKDYNLQRELKTLGLDTEEVWAEISANKGSCQSVAAIPKSVKNVFRTSFDINWRDHVRAQAVWQTWINNAISKTINLPNHATVEDIKNAYILAHESGLKGITVYRDGSRHEQVLHA